MLGVKGKAGRHGATSLLKKRRTIPISKTHEIEAETLRELKRRMKQRRGRHVAAKAKPNQVEALMQYGEYSPEKDRRASVQPALLAKSKIKQGGLMQSDIMKEDGR